MTTATGPLPPPLSADPADNVPMETTSHSSTQMKPPMGPPPPKNPSPPPPPPQNRNPTPPSTSTTDSETSPPETSKHQSQGFAVPYSIPEWSGAPCHQFQLEVLKDSAIVDQFNVYEKGAYMFGRVDLCNFVLEHPTISLFHAVLQFKRSGDAYIYDLGSTHGTFVNKNHVSMNFSHDMDHEYEKICRRMNPPSLDGLKRQSNLKYGVEVVKSDEQVHLVKRKSKCKLSKLN